uniref:Large ribosomal subunit protein uL3m n=1 Tax=Esox lucius TaxID=8010 RepID=A0A3P8XBQ0_ESOLU
MAALSRGVLLCRVGRVVLGRTGAAATADSCLFQSFRTVKTTTWWEEHLTEDNKSYMRKSLGEEYNQQIAAKFCPLKDEPWPRHEWTKGSRRVGLVAVKLGMAPVWTKMGDRQVVTLLQVQDCHVLKYLSKEEYDGHTAALLVGGKNASSFYVMPSTHISLQHLSFKVGIVEGTSLRNILVILVNNSTINIGKGFQGVMKRYGFKGQPATHGQTKTHRRPGASGPGGDPAKVFKGKKMPGRMGNVFDTAHGLKVWRVNTRYNIIYVHGSVPGHRNCILKVADSILPNRLENNFNPPFPTFFSEEEQLPEDLYDEDMFIYTAPSLEL